MLLFGIVFFGTFEVGLRRRAEQAEKGPQAAGPALQVPNGLFQQRYR